MATECWIAESFFMTIVILPAGAVRAVGTNASWTGSVSMFSVVGAARLAHDAAVPLLRRRRTPW